MTAAICFRRVRVAVCLVVPAVAAAVLSGVSLLAGTAPKPVAPRLVYVGTYTSGTSKGIYAFHFDTATGAFTPAGLAVETPNPSFVILSPDHRRLFAVNELQNFEGTRSGSVRSFAVDPETTRLTELSVQATHGADPCHLALDRTGRLLVVSNYTSGNYAVFPVTSDGRIRPSTDLLTHTGSGPNRARQQGPHAHEAVFDPANRFVLAADLGLDRVHVYRADLGAGRLRPNDPPDVMLPPGSGPRHLAFAPNGRWVYVITEMGSTVSAFTWDGSSGTLRPIGTPVSTLPAGFHGQSSGAEIAVHASGRFLYASNRGHDSIAVFRIGDDGGLTLVEHVSTRGKTPRDFSIDPSGQWLVAANQDSNTMAVFHIDQATGRLTPTGPLTDIGSPVSIVWY